MQPASKAEQLDVIFKETRPLANHHSSSLTCRACLDHYWTRLSSHDIPLHRYHRRRCCFLHFLDLRFLGFRHSRTPKKNDREYRVHPTHFTFHFFPLLFSPVAFSRENFLVTLHRARRTACGSPSFPTSKSTWIHSPARSWFTGKPKAPNAPRCMRTRTIAASSVSAGRLPGSRVNLSASASLTSEWMLSAFFFGSACNTFSLVDSQRMTFGYSGFFVVTLG